MTFDWRGTLFMLSGCVLQTLPFSALLFPPEKKQAKDHSTTEKPGVSSDIDREEERKEENVSVVDFSISQKESIEKESHSLESSELSCKWTCHRCKYVSIQGCKGLYASFPNLKDPVCILSIVGIFFLFIAYNIPFVYVAVLVNDTGHSMSTAVQVIAVSGFANIAIRPIVSVVACLTNHLPFYICIGSLILFGVVNVALIFSKSVLMLTVMMAVVGIAFGECLILLYLACT